MGLFGGLYISLCLVLGLTLAILLDQKIRGEGVLRPIYLYPLALSFIVTGTAWKLFLDPGIGLEKAVHDWGWTSFKFDWVVNPRMMIYCVAIAGNLGELRLRHGVVSGGTARHRRRDFESRADRRRFRLRDLSAHHHPDHAAGVSFGADHSDPPGDQILRSRAFGHRQESRRRRRTAVDLHVFLYVHAQSDGGRLDERGHHADDDRRHHGAVPLFGIAGEAADERRSTPRPRRPAASPRDPPRRPAS